MSYILDALKKAERERGLARVPDLGSVHTEPQAPRRGRWIVSAVALAVLIALLWAFYPRADRDMRLAAEPPEGGAVAAGPVAAPAPAGEPPAAGRGEEGARRQATPPAAPVAASVPRQAAPPAPAPGPPATRNPPAPVSAATPATPASPVPDIPLRDAVAGMTLSVHMYSEQPEDRMVFINGRRYVEGELVDRRYLLESITPEGAVLRLGGEREIVRPGN
ncbi:MAG: general secretion pathway protein GspB [Acidobacteria bacterium]|nr:general secretion pathway protein GspB [Acidobacteriota bacterium]